MQFDFDEIIERAGTSCYKFDMRNEIFKTEDVFPMWVADSDFRVHPGIQKALEERIKHGIFGYTFKDDDYYNAIINWNKKRHNWDIKKEWIQYSPGVVPSLGLAVDAFTEPGDKVIIQSPVYFPFYSVVTDQKRKILRNPLKLVDGRYQMDLEQLEADIDEKTKLLFLCSPHNPSGNVWHKDELKALCDICVKHNIIIISDEIHADIVFGDNKHIPTATLSEEIAALTITLMAPSKTFNIAGLQSSYIVAQNKDLFKKITRIIDALHLRQGNLLALTATIAAYNEGEEWLKEMIAYLEGTINYVKGFLAKEMPQVKLINPEGTFLLWFDFSTLNLDRKALYELMVQKAKIGLSDGPIFGSEGTGFQRMNIACPRSYVVNALEKIKDAIG